MEISRNRKKYPSRCFNRMEHHHAPVKSFSTDMEEDEPEHAEVAATLRALCIQSMELAATLQRIERNDRTYGEVFTFNNYVGMKGHVLPGYLR